MDIISNLNDTRLCLSFFQVRYDPHEMSTNFCYSSLEEWSVYLSLRGLVSDKGMFQQLVRVRTLYNNTKIKHLFFIKIYKISLGSYGTSGVTANLIGTELRTVAEFALTVGMLTIWL
jgi:hypothetical protein